MKKPDEKQQLRAFSERLNALLDERGFPSKRHGRQTQLAKDLKCDQKAVRRWLEGLGYPRAGNINKLCEFLRCSESLLMYGQPLNSDKSAISSHQFTVEDENLTPDTTYSTYVIGAPIVDLADVAAIVCKLSKSDFVKMQEFRSKIEGSAMVQDTAPTFPHGSIICWHAAETADTGQFVIAQNEEGAVIFRQLDHDGTRAVLRPLNNQYPVYTSEFKIIAIVTGKYEPLN